jgi:P-type E1-E2 ATPase
MRCPRSGQALRTANIVDRDRSLWLLTGEDLVQYSSPALREAPTEENVFARARPKQKLQLVEALPAQGRIVSMTREGVNDAPALKHSNVAVVGGLAVEILSASVARRLQSVG